MHQKWRHGGAAGAHSLQLLLLGAVPVQDLAHALLGILLPRSVASEARLGARLPQASHETSIPVLCRMLTHEAFCTWDRNDQRRSCPAV